MNRRLLLPLTCLFACLAHGQYPYTQFFDMRVGQQRPKCHSLVQDSLGLLWVASDMGLLRTDGDLTDLIWEADGASITALCANGRVVYAATSRGVVLRCSGYSCDTLFADTLFRAYPARSMLVGTDGRLWVGTYGGGLLIRHNDRIERLELKEGLPDGHVNALCAMANGGVVAATDQGLAICSPDGVVQRVHGEEQGLPDNLVTALTAGDNGRIWVGTDAAGATSFDPLAHPTAKPQADLNWDLGPVTALAWGDGHLWYGTVRHGTVVRDLNGSAATYVSYGRTGEAPMATKGLCRAHDGSVWTCDGSERLRRSDPDALLIPEHEGVDLRGITALCIGPDGRLWCATPEGVFSHAAGFADVARIQRQPIATNPNNPVVCLRVDTMGALWAGTMGNGLFRLRTTGQVDHFTMADGLVNDNILSIRMRGPEAWFATLEGVSYCPDVDRERPVFARAPQMGSGFVYDVMPMKDGRVLAATDGTGLVEMNSALVVRELSPAGTTYYSLCADPKGQVWSCGPGTGLCKLSSAGIFCERSDHPPFDGVVFGLCPFRSMIFAVAEAGPALFDPATSMIVDLGQAYGLAGIQAELNVVTQDRDGAVWFACDRGLARLNPRSETINSTVPCSITAVLLGERTLDLAGKIELDHDENFVTIRFAGIRYSALEAVRFEYRLVGFDSETKITRDRDVSWSHLSPGTYRFDVRAFMTGGPEPAEWASLAFTIAQPWWLRPWAVVLWMGLAGTVALLLVRLRDSHIRLQERMEKDKVRFQMEVLRSQVNPHFLFNSFNTLIELIDDDKDKAVQHVEHLSDFFREILQVRDKELIPLREELELVDTYFLLERRRFGDRIDLQLQVPEEALDRLVPPLTVQLLVENALKHNRASDTEPLTVELVADLLRLTVSNPDRPREAMAASTGFGINSIRQRYQALTPDPVTITRDNGRFSVTIPLIQNHEDPDRRG
jgi:ligand-binding sensor domain-containing protein/uncharacterized membrane-anchored protein YhcB (DUF1043 family)